MISPEATAIAQAHAARDRDTLARLVAEGKAVRVRVDAPVARAFVRDIEARARPAVNLAIRARKKGGRKR